MGADQDHEQSAFQAAAVGLSLGSLRNQRSLRGGVLGGRSARDCGLVVTAPDVVLGAQPAGCGGREFVAVHLGRGYLTFWLEWSLIGECTSATERGCLKPNLMQPR